MSAAAKRQGLAIASLVLGLISIMCFGIIAGVPAIILGHLAYSKARKAPDQYAGSNFAIAGFVMGYASILTTVFLTAVLAGMLLPALAKAKAKAQSIKCVNNLKQVGLAFRIWAQDHQDRFPFNPPAQDKAAGAEKETSDDPVLVFQALANELVNPSILVCPADSSKSPASNFASLHAGNVSYDLETGAGVTPANGQEVLARCPIHGHELYSDGSVQQTRRW